MRHKTGWFDKPGNFKKFLRLFFISLGALLLVDLFIPKHGAFEFEDAPEFFAAYGFICYVGLIMVAKLWRHVVKRREDYYDA